VPIVVSGEKLEGARFRRENPARLSETVAEVSFASVEQAQRAVAAAHRAFFAWRDRAVEERAEILLAAANGFRAERDALSSLMLCEVGKTPREADADVCEAIDFCEYYAREAVRLMSERRLGAIPGEDNRLFYEPRGVAAVIAPWNFPSAILTGMTTAALVTGNTVIMKPAEQSSAIAYRCFEILRAAGVPPDVLHFLPGRGEEIGAYLATAKEVTLVAFTGSRAVGLEILKGAATLADDEQHIRKIILELGGKNAIIVDGDADMDEAVLGIVQSAFGYQGQKCSACSRVIVLEERKDELVHRLLEATRSLKIGAPEAFENTFGPVIDAEAYERLTKIISERSKAPALASEGYYVAPTIVADVEPSDRLAQEELFGPVVAVMAARDFDHALTLANSTRYALTGGVFSRSPENLAKARREFRVGNLYLNRGITGALVGRQPFGGLKLSGIGSKAGGPDYLLQFVEPRATTENTMRRGFAPD
jgi:RHH-type proline utilization regulon transcriptional repressor/proline dehydrogenase/delta 1-pyrroline-5-carboxylate dehydrogenase